MGILQQMKTVIFFLLLHRDPLPRDECVLCIKCAFLQEILQPVWLVSRVRIYSYLLTFCRTGSKAELGG